MSSGNSPGGPFSGGAGGRLMCRLVGRRCRRRRRGCVMAKYAYALQQKDKVPTTGRPHHGVMAGLGISGRSLLRWWPRQQAGGGEMPPGDALLAALYDGVVE